MPDEVNLSQIVVNICGGRLCNDGLPHDDKATVVLYDDNGRASGASVACSRCGLAAIDHDLLEGP